MNRPRWERELAALARTRQCTADSLFELLDEYAVVFGCPGRISNSQPNLLPAFPVAQAYRQAVGTSVRVAGVTTHGGTDSLPRTAPGAEPTAD